MTEMKLYTVDFEPLWGVPCGLIILAENMFEAWRIACDTVKHTKVRGVTELPMEVGVVFYESGNY